MGEYPKERCTNFMRIPITGAVGNIGLYCYQKLALNNCKVTFTDGSTYLEK